MARDTAFQNALRNQILDLCFGHVDKNALNAVECFVACLGAAAVCAAVLPPASREKLMSAADDMLRVHTEKRAAEIRSGEFDRHLHGN